MQLDTEDIACLEKLGFIVEPALPADKKSRFKQIVQNPFIHLEDIRFWGVKFVRFPDQQRRLIHERSIYWCFGKMPDGYFALCEKDGSVCLISSDNTRTPISYVNGSLHTFSVCCHWFLSCIHRLIAERRMLPDSAGDDAVCAIEERIGREFVEIVRRTDPAALDDNAAGLFWDETCGRLMEAELGFHLPNFSLSDCFDLA